MVTWSVAEGRRGRRWREVVRIDDRVRSSLLLELDPDGRFSHLELSTAAGLLTLHPESDGTLHGNAVTSGGVRHVIGEPWDPDRAIALAGSVVCAAAATPNAARSSDRLQIGLDLAIARVAGRFEDGALVADGLPVLAEGSIWPLEQDD